jgi:hypothetical protein
MKSPHNPIFGSLGFLALFSSMACHAQEPVVQRAPENRDEVTAKPASFPSVFEADNIIVERYRTEAIAVAAPGAAIDTNGLLGRNKRDGRMISARFQLGGGGALRVGLHADQQMARNGFLAIEAGLKTVAPNGELISLIPPEAPTRAVLRDGDKASGAAFFLADACPALIALKQNPQRTSIAEDARIVAAEQAIGRGLTWLVTQSANLQEVDGRAPNRLLYNALAYHACGSLVGDRQAATTADGFVDRALSQVRTDGVFVERSGSDTTYQGVSLRLALDLQLTGYRSDKAEQLAQMRQRGARWLAGRIMADGRIDSSGNTRTCAGGERFLGVEKKAWPPGIFAALIYEGLLTNDLEIIDAAERLAQWARANPRANPCYP